MKFWAPVFAIALIAGATGWLCAHFGEPLLGVALGIALLCWLLKAYDRLAG